MLSYLRFGLSFNLDSFNIDFHRPKNDECSRCTKYKNSKKTLEIKDNHKIHLENKEMAREEKERDKARAKRDNTFVAVIGDLEQVGPCPKATAQEFYSV